MSNTTIFIVYKTDVHHSYASRDIIGIATDKGQALSLCGQRASAEGEKFDEDQAYNLNNLKQTQGYAGEGEFQFEEMETNELL